MPLWQRGEIDEHAVDAMLAEEEEHRNPPGMIVRVFDDGKSFVWLQRDDSYWQDGADSVGLDVEMDVFGDLGFLFESGSFFPENERFGLGGGSRGWKLGGCLKLDCLR